MFYINEKLNIRHLFIYFLIILYSASCQERTSELTPAELVQHYAGEKYYHSDITYQVNNFEYHIQRDEYRVILSLIETNKKNDKLRSVLENGIMREYLNDSLVSNEVDNYLKRSHLSNFTYSNSIPHVLTANDMEFNSKGFITRANKQYQVFKAQTKFVQDIDINEFYLYVDPITKDIMFISQKFVTESKIPRIKRFYNHRTINGIRFADYTQFVAREDTIDTQDLINNFNAKILRSFSDIKFENIKVTYND